MTVAKAKNGGIITYTGTSAEVAQALSNDQWSQTQILAIVYDVGNSKFVAFVKIL